MKSLRFKILSGVVIGCISIVLMGVFISSNIQKIQVNQNELLEAEKHIFAVKELQTQILDMESGIRGYLLGGRTEDLEPFSKTEGLFDKHLSPSLFSSALRSWFWP